MSPKICHNFYQSFATAKIQLLSKIQGKKLNFYSKTPFENHLTTTKIHPKAHLFLTEIQSKKRRTLCGIQPFSVCPPGSGLSRMPCAPCPEFRAGRFNPPLPATPARLLPVADGPQPWRARSPNGPPGPPISCGHHLQSYCLDAPLQHSA